MAAELRQRRGKAAAAGAAAEDVAPADAKTSSGKRPKRAAGRPPKAVEASSGWSRYDVANLGLTLIACALRFTWLNYPSAVVYVLRLDDFCFSSVEVIHAFTEFCFISFPGILLANPYSNCFAVQLMLA